MSPQERWDRLVEDLIAAGIVERRRAVRLGPGGRLEVVVELANGPAARGREDRRCRDDASR